MNREQALQWLVENLKEWSWEDKLNDSPSGWKWNHSRDIGFYLFSPSGEATIFEQDWLAAKQSAPLTRDQALAWAVENVADWPEDYSKDAPRGWYWLRTVPHTGMAYIYLNSHNGERLIAKQDWQSALPAPASNECSPKASTLKDILKGQPGVFLHKNIEVDALYWKYSAVDAEYWPTQDLDISALPKLLQDIAQRTEDLRIFRERIELMQSQLDERNIIVAKLLRKFKYQVPATE